MNVYFNNWSKALVVFFKILHIFFGYDLGFFKYKSFKVKCVAKSLCVLQCLFIICSLTIWGVTNDQSYKIPFYLCWLCALLSQYFIYVIMFTLFKSDATLFQFQCSLQLIDRKLRAEKLNSYIEKKIVFMLSAVFFNRVVLSFLSCFMYCDNCCEPVWLNVIYMFIALSHDAILISIGYIFYAISHRLKVLSLNLKTNNEQILSLFLGNYKLIADVVEKFKSAFESVYLTRLLCSVPNVMFTFYHAIWFMKTNQTTVWHYLFIGESLTFVLDLLVTLGPALFASKMLTQVERIKGILYDNLLQEKDESKCREIERFIHYVEARPLKFTVYKVIPLDVSLHGMVLNFCVTYLIVMIQFSHLY